MECTEIFVGGLKIQVWGLPLLPRFCPNGVAILFALHGRQNSRSQLRQTAIEAIEQSAARDADGFLPLLVVTWDLPNHGQRIMDAGRNEGLDQNKMHALDLTAVMTGTSHEVSWLIDILPSVLFPDASHVIARWMITGVSLGGHIAWHSSARDIRLTHLAPILASPSIRKLLAHRGAAMPASLVTLLSHADADRLPLVLWQDRKLLVIAAGMDTLVPFRETGSADFLAELSSVAQVETFMDEQAAHDYTQSMRQALLSWLAATACKL